MGGEGEGEGVGRGLRFGLIPSPDKCSPCFLKFSQFIFFYVELEVPGWVY